jgi:hypothetical protein
MDPNTLTEQYIVYLHPWHALSGFSSTASYMVDLHITPSGCPPLLPDIDQRRARRASLFPVIACTTIGYSVADILLALAQMACAYS